MSRNKYIAPSLLAADFTKLRDQVESVEQAGAQWLHFDIMDGHFVPNITFGAMVLNALRPYSKMFFDAHLMITEPDNYITEVAKAGAENITIHYETVTHLHRTLSFIKEQGCKTGISFNPATPINFEAIDYIKDKLDLILIMTVNPGFGGQKFISNVVNKIKKTREYLDKNNLENIMIEVDGGINTETARIVLEAGANVLVAGSSIFGKEDINSATKDLLATF